MSFTDFQVNGSVFSRVSGTGTTVKYFPRLLGPSIGVAPATPSATNPTGFLAVPAQNVVNSQWMNVIASGSALGGSNTETATVNLYAVTGSIASPTYTSIATTGAITVTALALTSVAASVGSTAVYTGTITGGGSNAFAGKFFRIVGFTNASNNGTFQATASSTTTLTLSNAAAVAETASATAVSDHGWGLNVQLIGDNGSGTLGGNYFGVIDGAAGSLTTTTNVISNLNFNTGNSGLNGAVLGLVVGVTFSVSDANNLATLKSFSIV